MYMSKEKDCKWFFGTQDSANIKGPNNATTMSFKDEDFNSLVRESIQNSLDAIEDKSKPVEVSFAIRGFSGLEFPNFFELKKHIQGCLDMFPYNENAAKRFTPMLDKFANSKFNQEIRYLRIVDRNTTGMNYDENDTNSGFFKFLAEGVAQDKEGSGGAFGFGKDAFWALSPIGTVFVSSMTGQQVNFAGLAKLCTHIIGNNRYVPNGQYCTNGEGLVISDKDKIPDEFLPKEIGTSVFVLGIDHIDEGALVRSVLRNFWMAIHKEKLVVKVEGRVIDKIHLSEIMSEYFSSEDEFDEISNYKYSPRNMYNILVNAENGIGDYRYLEGCIPMNGKDCGVKLYIHKYQEAKGEVVFMRSPLMTVYHEKNICKGADCVFICDSDEGNKFLRECENYKHDWWHRKCAEERGNIPGIVASRAIRAIYSFIKETVRAERDQDAKEIEQVAGLDKILTISTPKGADDESKKDDIVDLENIFDNNKKRETQKKTTQKPNIRQPRQTRATFDSQGRLLSNSGGKRKKRPIKTGPVKPGSLKNKSIESKDGKLGIYATPIDVSYRTWSQVDTDNKVWHLIRIFSDTEIDNALIQVYGVDEEGKSFGLNIEEIIGYETRVGEEFIDNTDFEDNDIESNGTAKQVMNAIGGVHINANIPLTLKLRFNSDIKYSLRINSDRIESNENK